MPATPSHWKLNVARIGLICIAVAIVAYYALQRHSAIERQAKAAARSPQANRAFLLPSMEFMAREQARRFFNRLPGKYIYPSGELRDDPDHPVEFRAFVKDRPTTVAAYYVKTCNLHFDKRIENGAEAYTGTTRVSDRNVRIVIAQETAGSTITYSLPDMVLPKRP